MFTRAYALQERTEIKPMTDITAILSLLSKAGAISAALIVFAIWWLYLKAITAQFQTILEQQSKREEKYFELLQESIDTNKLMLSTLQQISSSIETNNWCPLAKEFTKEVLKFNPQNNQA